MSANIAIRYYAFSGIAVAVLLNVVLRTILKVGGVPANLLVAALIGGQLLGIVGVLLALPAAAVSRVALDYVLERRPLPLPPSVPTDEPVAPDPEGGRRRAG